MENYLDDSERERLKAQLKRELDARTSDRIKAVLLRDKGWTYQKIADALFITTETARMHALEYETIGKLVSENGGSSEKLNKAQAEVLEGLLEESIYSSAKEVVKLVEEEFGVSFSISGITTWLKKHGFSYKKPSVVPGKADTDSQKEWIEEYTKLKQSLGEDEAVMFMDGVHPTHNTKPSYGWMRSGERKEILSNTGRQRINITGAIDIDSKKTFCKEDETLNADSTIGFLKFIERKYPEKKKIYLFCDNARYYRNKKVEEYLQTSRIILKFLPPYSPNLNPIERLWKFMNEQVINNKYYPDFKGFKNKILQFLSNLADPPNDIKNKLASRITDNFMAFGT